MPSGFKTIDHEGIVRFRIPETWTEGPEENGTAVFQENRPDAAIFRVHLHSFQISGPVGDEMATDLLHSFAEELPHEVVPHADGNLSTAYWKRDVHEGTPIALKFWCVMNRVPPSHVRVAIFTYTLDVAQLDDPRFVEEIKMIDREIMACEFAEQVAFFERSH